MKRILAYSDNIVKAKPTPRNSVLKPDTNSDPASAKLNGVRLVCARIVMNQHNPRGKHKYRGHLKYEDLATYPTRSSFLTNIKGERIMIIRATS